MFGKATTFEAWVQLNQIVSDLDGHSDRELVVIGVAVLEDALRELLQNALVIDAEAANRCLFTRSLRSLDSRAELARALGLIPEGIKTDLDKVKKIRNEFAHSYWDLSLSTTPISALCKDLVLVDHLSWLSLYKNMDSTGQLTFESKNITDAFYLLDCRNEIVADVNGIGTDLICPKVRFSNAIKLIWLFIVDLVCVQERGRLTSTQ